MIVTLTPDQWDDAESFGERREQLKVQRGKEQTMPGDKGGSWMHRNRVGIVAECALARQLGPDVLEDWINNKAFSLEHWKIKCDVGKNLHVRATDNPRARLLIVHEAPGQCMEPASRRKRRPTDPADGVFILAYVDRQALSVTYYGWQWSGWVQENVPWNTTGPGFFRNDRHAFTLDKDDLLPMSTIPPEAIR